MPITRDENTRFCRRCGTCCAKGGPALHRDDRRLVEEGKIALTHLYTIRIGEPIYDNVQNKRGRASEEIIRIKGLNDAQTCRHYDDGNNRCRIYDHRPLECRLLKCWDTSEIEAMYASDRLNRKDLLGEVEGLWDLIADHDQRCGYIRIAEWAGQLQHRRDRQTAAKIVEAVSYDIQLRRLLVEQRAVDPELLDFLLGRPLEKIFPAFGYDIRREGKIVRFEKKGSFRF
jgi:Fe-S-cluster containining protein